MGFEYVPGNVLILFTGDWPYVYQYKSSLVLLFEQPQQQQQQQQQQQPQQQHIWSPQSSICRNCVLDTYKKKRFHLPERLPNSRHFHFSNSYL